MSIEQRILSSGILIVLVAVSGVWLSRFGKPYNVAFFTLHKVLALAAVILIATLFFDLYKAYRHTGPILLLTVSATLSAIALFATGAFLSIGKIPINLLKPVHIIASIVFLCSTVYSLYLSSLRR